MIHSSKKQCGLVGKGPMLEEAEECIDTLLCFFWRAKSKDYK